jgi:hypothetical protein
MSLRRTCRHGLPALLLSAAAGAASAATADGWPALPLPAGAQVVDVGAALRINGLPMQVRGFLSPERVPDLVAWFRASLGSPLVTSEHGNKIILGQVRGGYYLTVQLEAAGSGTRGLVAQADAQTMMAGGLPPVDDVRWHGRLPAGARILSLVQSRSPDGARQLQHLVLQSHGALIESGNALTRMLGNDGYLPARSVSRSSPPGLVLHFQGPGREAMAVLTEDADGMTSTVLSTSALVESAR